ncbi:hypothetical protein M408DRAFT_28095 [Serendipita vermifera MAFF 305830]|uniref:Uncharacterized protein n=1 Tax=Serendipita vermifera MAFF 305830 TaxID=933852 RepID=A0A0C3AVC6_SERVB|nr:hypothetical protein M408DRAFT_28095 [Serendipita vermifera MAFF 305830]
MGVAASSACGGGSGCLGMNQSDEIRLSKGIDRGLRETRRNLANTPKILLLGAGESGKSTIIKVGIAFLMCIAIQNANYVWFTQQMRLLNNVPFSEHERELYRVQVFYNLVGGMRSLLEAMKELAPAITSEDLTGAAGAPATSPGTAPATGAGTGSAVTGRDKPRRPPFHVNADNVIEVEEQERTTSPPTRRSQDPHGLSLTDEPSSSKQAPEVTETSGASGVPRSDGSRSPTRSPSLSLNIFSPGALSQRQHAALLNELHYIPDIRPGEPFPIHYEALLRGLWWGWDDAPEGEFPAGTYLDRIQSETGIALPDNLNYFFESPAKLAHWFGDEYVPSDEDVLRCRGRTTGIQETIFTLGKNGLGQALKERRKNANTTRTRTTRTRTSTTTTRASSAQSTQRNSLEKSDESTATTGTATTQTKTTTTTGGSTQVGTTGTGTTTTMSGTTVAAHTHRPPPGQSISQQQQQSASALRLPMGKTRLHLVDVGGQRSERRKWMHCFQDVTAVLFLVGLSGYSQGMLEDPASNQMQDAMSLWDGVCSSQWFKNTSLILFLNKSDLFAEKLSKFPIKNYFPDYEGGETDVAAGKEYFRRRFLRVYSKSLTRRAKPSPTTSALSGPVAPTSTRDKGKGRAGTAGEIDRRTVYSHFTTATDTTQLKRVMVAVCDIILRDNLLAATFL